MSERSFFTGQEFAEATAKFTRWFSNQEDPAVTLAAIYETLGRILADAPEGEALLDQAFHKIKLGFQLQKYSSYSLEDHP